MSLPTDNVRQDDRGFQKAEMQIMDPREANFQETGNEIGIFFTFVDR